MNILLGLFVALVLGASWALIYIFWPRRPSTLGVPPFCEHGVGANYYCQACHKEEWNR